MESYAGIEVGFEPFLLFFVLWALIAYQGVSVGDVAHLWGVGFMTSLQCPGASQTDPKYAVRQSLGAGSRYELGELCALQQVVVIAGAHCAHMCCRFFYCGCINYNFGDCRRCLISC